MADGESTAGGIGMGMIIALLAVLLVLLAGGFYFFGGSRTNPVASAGQSVSSTASDAGHTVSGTVNVH